MESHGRMGRRGADPEDQKLSIARPTGLPEAARHA